jgi:clusterin-associated protein 1
MRQLGYPRRISLENFKQPNFQLVAELLYWMVQRYDPTADVSDNIDEEDDRVKFIKSVTQFFGVKARLKLQPLKLYQANEQAVKELLKVASMLSKAMSSSMADEEDSSTVEFNLSSKLYNLKQARQLASEITENGAKLYEQLSKEKELRQARGKAIDFLDSISRNLDSNAENEYIDKCIKDIIKEHKESLVQMEKMLENLKADEGTLEQKIKRKSDELERAEKRLNSIKDVRPAFMDEYEQLEKELEMLYMIYVEGIRNLDYLENELDEYNRKEMEKKEESERKLEELRNKLQDKELREITGKAELDENDVDEEAMRAMDEMGETRSGFNKKRPAVKSNGGQKKNVDAMRNLMRKQPAHAIEEEDVDEVDDIEGGSGEVLGADDEENPIDPSDSELAKDEDDDNNF